MSDYWTGSVNVFWILLLLTLFGGLVIPLLMGACVWIERREHRIRLSGVSPGDWWVRQRRAAIDRERIARFSPRHLRLTDLIRVWPLFGFAFVLLMPVASWTSIVRDDLLFVIHPIVCLGWWLNMRSRGIIHAEVYALSLWIFAYTAWALSVLAPPDYWQWGIVEIDRDFTWFVSDTLGLTSDQALLLWVSYAASGIICVLVGIIFARINRPRLRPLVPVAVWIPLASGVWINNFVFGILGLVISIGVAGYGISREVRRSQDDANIHPGSAVRETHSTSRWKASTWTVLGTAAVIGIAVSCAIWVRESVMFNQATFVAATWSAMALAALISATLSRLLNRPSFPSEWATWAFLATAGVLAAHHLIDHTLPWFSQPSWGGDPNQEGTFFMFAHVQALAAGIAAVVLIVVAYRAGKLRSYGALLVGMLWLPLSLYAAGLHSSLRQDNALLDPAGIAGMVAMGCVLLVIMWRVFGPGETAIIDMNANWVVPKPDCDRPEAQSKSMAAAPESAA